MSTRPRRASPAINTPAPDNQQLPENAIVENAYPRVLGGKALKQLAIPKSLLPGPAKPREPGTTVKASDLAQILAAIKARRR